MDGDADTVPGAFNHDAGNGGGHQLFLDVLAHHQVFMQLGGVILARGVPLGAPVLVDGELNVGDIIDHMVHKA